MAKVFFSSFKNMTFPHDYVFLHWSWMTQMGCGLHQSNGWMFVSLSVPQMPASQVTLPGPTKPPPPGHIISVLIDLAVFSLYACLSSPTSPWLAYSAIWFSNTNLPNLLPAKNIPPASLLLSIPYFHLIRSLVPICISTIVLLRGIGLLRKLTCMPFSCEAHKYILTHACLLFACQTQLLMRITLRTLACKSQR